MTLSEPENPLSPNEMQTSESGSMGAPEIHPAGSPAQNENVPEDIRVPWGGGELLLLLGFAIGSLFFLEIILELFLLAHYHMSREQLLNLLKTNAGVAVGFQAFWSGIIFLFLFLMIRQYNRSPFWSSLRWRALHPRNRPAGLVYFSCILGGVALAITVGIASHFAGEKTNLPIEKLFNTRADVIWLMIFGICVAPFFEETIFRGYLYPVFARKWGIPAGIFVTGLLFGLMHAVQLWGGWVQIALLVLVGIILTTARARTGSVVASYLIHVSYNSFLFMAFLISTHGLKNIPHVH
jgi:membrane protease YdiL (CAAX protease family)